MGHPTAVDLGESRDRTGLRRGALRRQRRLPFRRAPLGAGAAVVCTLLMVVSIVGQPGPARPTGLARLTSAVSACATVASPGAASGVAVAAVALSPQGGGWDASAGGAVTSFGGEVSYGSLSGPLNRPIVGMVSTPDGGGYWLVAADGGIFSFGDARFFGSMGGITLEAPVVAMGVSSDGGGYWEFAADGGVFSFGSATYAGRTGVTGTAYPIVAGAAS